MSQTSREVIWNTLSKQGKPDRIGVVDSPWADALRLWVKNGYPTEKVVREDPNHPELGEQEFADPVSPTEHFSFDIARIGAFDMMPLRGHSELLQETAEWTIKRNGAGAALKYWKNKSGTPEHIDFLMTSREVWERDYRPYLLHLDPQRIDLPKSKEAFAKWRGQGKWLAYSKNFIWENMRQSMGDVTMYTSLALDPEWIHDYNRVHTDFFKAHYKYLFEQVGIPDGIWMSEDLGYKHRLFCSPKMLAELIFPYFAEVNAFFHSYGLQVVLHSCGRMTEALPLIVEAGFDAVNPMEVKAGNDLFAFAEQYGDKLAFVCGVDARIFETGDRALIRREVTRYIEGMKARGARWVFGSDHSISTNTSYASFQYALEVYRELMWY
jgi:uroporphyrinogen decarboxylase